MHVSPEYGLPLFLDMLAVIVELICTLHTALSEWEESDMLVRMQLFSYVSSLCAQNKKNCRSVLSSFFFNLLRSNYNNIIILLLLVFCFYRALLKLQHWQHWLLRLADQRMTMESGTHIRNFLLGGGGLYDTVLNLILCMEKK